MSIDENNAYEITEKLSFPRLAGSDREKKVHTKHDNMNLVSREGLHDILLITVEVIKMISEDFVK